MQLDVAGVQQGGKGASREEARPIEQYIKEALQQGYVQPSTSPASAGVFFVKKRDRGLRPCVDYRGLNKLLVQYLYPLPLLAVDFVTDLLVSEGNTMVLSIVDQFSLVALPTTWEMADLLFRQVFRQFGLPEDIVSDRGP
ncbi:hypothetical protein P4O66_002308 [Electrophorus voltai]|uniref:Integrase catalytic domain-containing protein n=1 Tax=Electrophorus voltai TaxID=2609070 RepID=A0AAD8YZS8_9TELE|nr:hypothetical protein P4O66_002308 [Electrophorus voltai]